MKNISLKYSILLALISGALVALVFPTRFGSVMLPNLGFLAWFSLVPLFVAINGAGLRRTFGLTFITGFVLYAVSLYWLYNALTQYGKQPPATAVSVLFLMMVILGVYTAIITSITKWLKSRLDIPTIVLLPVVWIGVELVRNYFPVGGFPWNNLAYSQAGYPLMIQTADLFGIYGVTFLIIMVNRLCAELILEAERIRISKIISVAVLFVLFVGYGWYRLDAVRARSPGVGTVRIALVQGNIPQDEKSDDSFFAKNLEVYRDYMKWVEGRDISLTLWPESAYPYLIPLSAAGIKPHVLGLDDKREDASWILFGALSVRQEDSVFYNSAILVDNHGNIKDRYHKVHLVPFGEYVPFRKALFFVKKLVDPVGDFLPGEGFRSILVKGDYRIGPLICYEDVFPEISRAFTKNGANILVNLTNDAWYGWTSAAYQHLAISIFRAVENRRYLLRVTNTGVTAVVDPRGKVELKSGLFERGFMVSGIPLLGGLTVYDRVGDFPAYLSLVLIVLASGVSIGRRFVGKKVKRGENDKRT